MLIDLHPEPADMEQLVIEGMERQPRQLPAWLLYDAEGSRLFEAICAQPEYSLTRTETTLLEGKAAALAEAVNGDAVNSSPSSGWVVVEFGAGNARKVGPLLEALVPAAYLALDISADHLAPACRALQERHPTIPVLGICCDYSRMEQMPEHPLLQRGRRLGFYPGSSLGNFDPPAARQLLGQFARLLGPDSRLLVGIDQPKPVAQLEAAYNDRAGWSAAFALNLLRRLNRDLDGNFAAANFRYRAWWEADHNRIAMALISQRSHDVELAGRCWRFATGEPLITEYSYKYAQSAFNSLAEAAHWHPCGHWSDPHAEVGLHLLSQADLGSPPQRQP